MEIILHLGAHRTASTSFQHYLRKNGARLAAMGIGVWGPPRTRDGLMEGVLPRPGLPGASKQVARAAGRIALALHDAEAAGIRQLIVSDENMIGSPRGTLRDGRLYAAMGERMARYDAAFGGRVSRVVLSIRAQDAWWPSCIAYAVARGARLPRSAHLARIATSPRGWRDVITDLACAVPSAEVMVMPHESFAARPEARLTAMTGQGDAPLAHAREWLNRAPDLAMLRRLLHERGGDPRALPQGEGRWQPFSREERAALSEAYADDLFWLRAGAGGLATLMEEPGKPEAGTRPAGPDQTRGRPHDQEGARRLAQAGRG
ncbi:hypothetical protein [Roseovarius aquimarinus]|uniref:Sulfotransferase family protein n=1 Tax=Roseovarius aquimarinus TaxID=1229156 RepID=A0ABW7I4T8_9RHOB